MTLTALEPGPTGTAPAERPDLTAQERPPSPTARHFTILLIGGLVLTAVGVVEMVAWRLHATALLQLRESWAPMVFNTALGLAVTGSALVMVARGRMAWVLVAGWADLMLGGASLVERFSGTDLGIDELFVNAYVSAPGQRPGLMATNTAICLVATGLALLLPPGSSARLRRAALATAAAVVAVVSVSSLVSYLLNEPREAGGWNGLTMALPTALSMSLLAGLLLLLSWLVRPDSAPSLSRWMVVPTGTAVFVATGSVWQVLVEADRTGQISAGRASTAVLLQSTIAGGLLAWSTWEATRARQGRRRATTLAQGLTLEVARRRAAEAELKEREHQLIQILDTVPVGVMVVSPGGVPFHVNRAAARLLGSAPTSGAGPAGVTQAYPAFVAGTDQPYPPDCSPSARALRGQATHVDDLELHRPDGVAYVEAWGAPVLDLAGRVSFGVEAVIDVTHRRRIEQTLHAQARMLDLAHDLIYVHDPNGCITYWNHGAELEYGWSTQEAVGRISNDLLRTEFPEPPERISAALLSEGQWSGELTHRTRDGCRRVVSARWIADCDQAGRLVSVLCINSDVTDRKAAAAELEQLNRALASSNQDLERFAYAASHDLSEPLRAISGPVSLLARRYRGQLDDDADQLIDFAVDGCARMQTLIEDLLTYSRVGRLEARQEPVDTRALVEQVLRVVLQDADDDVIVTRDELPVVLGEPSQLNQLFQNLLSNAVKFRVRGSAAHVHVGYEHASAEGRFTFTDDGIGIDPAHRERVFGMFKRLNSREAYPGTGIGLALCQRIVERHGGTIGVEQAPSGSGSTFWFTLPTISRGPHDRTQD